MEFLSVNNFKVCNDIFCKFMQDEYGINIQNSGNAQALKPMMYNVMQNVRNALPNDASLKTLNNAVLNELRDAYLSKYGGGTKKPRVRNLERDQQIYGHRTNQLGEQVMFEMNPPRRDDINSIKPIDDIVKERSQLLAGQNPNVSDLPFKVEKIPDPPNSATMLKKLEYMEKMRDQEIPIINQRFETSVQIQQDELPDPKALFAETSKAVKAKHELDLEEHNLRTTPYQNHAQEALIIPNMDTYDKTTYVIFNGYDRLWNTYPYRYSFVIDINDVSRSLKNVTEICFTRLIIPMETLNGKKNTLASNDTRYYNQYGLTYPYLMLQVDELSPGMYQGFNKTTQKCFTSFVYHREYKASNGRGFIVMQPLQGEKKEFYGAPLSSLPRMTISVIKPNGTLYNLAKDENRIDYIIYESINPLFLKIVCKDFFDINEYAVGDVVLVKDFKLPTIQQINQLVIDSTGAPIPDSDVALYANGIVSVEEFINRDEGHEIIATGDPNANSYMNNFSIYMPRMLNKSQGTLVLQKDFFDCINVMQQYLGKVTHTQMASFLNMTLQVVLTMKIKTTSSDVSKVRSIR